MEKNTNIKDKIEATFNAIEAIEPVTVSPFFKDKTMQRLFEEKEEVSLIESWFSPKLQLATLVCVIVLNVVAFTQLNSNKYDSDINEFSETYGFSSDSNASLFN
ncbi:hypothetical protein [Flavivirga jejuensis]|uniref:Uncharacterized protein n=1 Tax=Flavivirga jejuensis TaxID=870487 RepID=A0ABT8WMM3_9FLAO|nr:hypothetical protein [Flavivirga jejuensis]MDO5974186.1 hypothetical protein [Flavivirga jejuensis]